MSEQTRVAMHGRNTRFGLVLFGVYLVMYVGFMGLAAFAPGLMARPVLAGINLAVCYGMALIFSAFILAMIYAVLSLPHGDETRSER
jgi:uncharacterized membrane protein (DUF485 family)